MAKSVSGHLWLGDEVKLIQPRQYSDNMRPGGHRLSALTALW